MSRVSVAVFLALLVAAPPATPAGNDEFDRVVEQLENHFGKKRTRIPFLGLANAMVKVARPGGASGFKLAVIESAAVRDGDEANFRQVVESALGTEWKPIVRVYTRRGNEWTTIYAREYGGQFRLLIATKEPDEVVLVRVTMNARRFAAWLTDREKIV